MFLKIRRLRVARIIACFGLAATIVLSAPPLLAQGSIRERLQKRFAQKNAEGEPRPDRGAVEKSVIGGVQVAIWRPTKGKAPYPLVIFSHGFHGSSTQSKFVMEALAKDGYLVVAPNHKDALGNGGSLLEKPEVPFQKAAQWTDKTYKQRADDVVNVMNALHKDPEWSSQIDWSKLVLSGHSLGGYTALGLAGAWPSWRLPGIKAVLALSPYCQPFIDRGTLAGVGVPIMYQGGTRDRGITPTLKGPEGAYSKTSSPAYFVEFDNVGHFDFSDLSRSQAEKDLIDHYALSFLDKYVKGDPQANPREKLDGVIELQTK